MVAAVATLRLALPRPGAIDVTPANAMPLPVVPEGTVGRVLVTVQYDVAPESVDAFLARSEQLRHFRQRTCAMEWRLFTDESNPDRYLETFLVATWEDTSANILARPSTTSSYWVRSTSCSWRELAARPTTT